MKIGYSKSKYFSITEYNLAFLKPFNRVLLVVGGSSLWQKIKGYMHVLTKKTANLISK